MRTGALTRREALRNTVIAGAGVAGPGAAICSGHSAVPISSQAFPKQAKGRRRRPSGTVKG